MVKQCIENNEIFGFIPKDDRNNRFVDTIGTCAYVKEIAEVGPTGESIIVIKGGHGRREAVALKARLQRREENIRKMAARQHAAPRLLHEDGLRQAF